MPDPACDTAGFDDETVGAVLRYACRERPRLVLHDQGKRGSRREAIQCFADVIRTLPRGKTTQVNFSRLCHDSHVLGKLSALLPEKVNREESEWYGLWNAS